MNEDLKIIKKKFGEKMMHLCRDLFPSILEEEGKLSQLLLDHFEPNHELYSDLVAYNKIEYFKKYIFNFIEKEEEILKTEKTPEELLSEAGYILYECKSEEEIQQFKKYYAPGEKLCTFYGGRLDRCHVFFAIKKNVDEIKREDFKNPERQDEYGTSVISIQFTKDGTNTLSIKNRYNHTVQNPDATFSNNLDNIIPGLTYSFEQYYGIKQKHVQGNFELLNYVRANGKYYKYKFERNNIYYCKDNIVINNYEVKRYEKEKYIVFDYFVLDLQNKKIDIIDYQLDERFVNYLQNIKELNVEKTLEGKIIYITPAEGEVIEIEIDDANDIIGYKNNNLTFLDDYFLHFNEKIKNIECLNLKKVGDGFLECNRCLTEINFPNLELIGNDFCRHNKIITKVHLPNVKRIKNFFFRQNEELTEISLPNVTYVGANFISGNYNIKKVDFPNLETVAKSFLFSNKTLEELSLSKLRTISDNFLYLNHTIKKLNLPCLKTIGNDFMPFNSELTILNLENVTSIGTNFLHDNPRLMMLNLPNVIEIGDCFLFINSKLKFLNLPCVQKIGENFLSRNENLLEFYAPKLRELGSYSLDWNDSLVKYDLRNLKSYSYGCLRHHPKINISDIVAKNKLGIIYSVIHKR